MTIEDRSALRQNAAARLGQAAYNPYLLALIHTAAALALSLVMAVLDLLLDDRIGTTGGLSGLGMRSVLETVRTVLQYANAIALPFWEFGFLFAAIRMARGEEARPASLLEGFRRFGPVLRLQLLRSFLFMGVAMICVYVAAFLYSVTPLATPLMELMEPLLQEGQTVEQMQLAMAEMPLETLQQAVWPMLVMAGVLCAVALIPMFYRLRLADWTVMDQPGTGALAAMLTSNRAMRRNCVKWFRLDLSFWWYYALLGVAALVTYGDQLLSAVGMELPMSAEVAWLVFYALGLVVQLLVYWLCRSRVETTYALAYDILRQQAPETPPVKPAPQNLPWEDYTAQ